MSEMDINLWALVFSVIAAVAGIIVARWEWMDRPTTGWQIVFPKPHFDERGRPRYQAAVFFQGEASIDDVEVHGIGYRTWTESDENRIPWNPSSDHLLFHYEPFEEGQEAYIEITWTTHRPLRHRGMRANTQTRIWQVWRWHWRSLRIKRAPGRRPEHPKWLRFFDYRPIRTKGRWVNLTRVPMIRIPRTELDPPPVNSKES